MKSLIRYKMQVLETIDKPTLFEIDYGKNFKKEKLALRCSADNVLLYFGNRDSKATTNVVVILKSKLLEQFTATK